MTLISVKYFFFRFRSTEYLNQCIILRVGFFSKESLKVLGVFLLGFEELKNLAVFFGLDFIGLSNFDMFDL